MSSIVKIYGRDYSPIIYSDRNENGDGIELILEQDRYLDEELEKLRSLLVFSFLNDVESHKDYRSLIRHSDDKSGNDNDYHIVEPAPSGKSEDARYSNVVGVLRWRECIPSVEKNL